jgi:hypothetical protein
MSSSASIDGIDPEALSSIVERYHDLGETAQRQKNETPVRQQFINPLLRALGWDTESEEVRPEFRTDVGPADYALILNGRDQFYLEAKKFYPDGGLDGYRLEDGERRYYVDQAIDYAYHQRCDWAVLTNFRELRLYWTHIGRDADPSKGLVLQLTVDDFTTDDGLEDLSKLSKRGVA